MKIDSIKIVTMFLRQPLKSREARKNENCVLIAIYIRIS